MEKYKGQQLECFIYSRYTII